MDACGIAFREDRPYPRVLIAEDDPVSFLVLRKTLESRGFEVDGARNGREALELFRPGLHRVVISDWMMPELDGVDVCRQIRAFAEPYTYVILLTAKSQREDRVLAYQSGVDDFLNKPLDREELFSRISVALRILAAEDDLLRQRKHLLEVAQKLEQANANLQMASRRFEELFQGLPVAAFTFDADGVVFEWNKRSEALFGFTGAEALLQSVNCLFGSPDETEWIGGAYRRVLEGRAVTGVDWVYVAQDGRKSELKSDLLPIHGVGGVISGGIAVNVDMTEQYKTRRLIVSQMETIQRIADELAEEKKKLEEANQRLEQLALTDGLTGLPNHRHFQEELERACKLAGRERRPISLVMLDVDFFKQYNDTFGHPAGDEVLRRVAEILAATVRRSDVPARYGGEEFAVILPNTPLSAAAEVAERIRGAVEAQPWELRPVTVSVGVASLQGDAVAAKEAIRRADEALYRSKRGGRNRVTLDDGSEGPTPQRSAA
ncbi:MAG: diguanylate cyclase [Fimbriimonadales bacterium]|nr:diguanylate cyclase [Fimbriimonadales bacterium]